MFSREAWRHNALKLAWFIGSGLLFSLICVFVSQGRLVFKSLLPKSSMSCLFISIYGLRQSHKGVNTRKHSIFLIEFELKALTQQMLQRIWLLKYQTWLCIKFAIKRVFMTSLLQFFGHFKRQRVFRPNWIAIKSKTFQNQSCPGLVESVDTFWIAPSFICLLHNWTNSETVTYSRSFLRCSFSASRSRWASLLGKALCEVIVVVEICTVSNNDKQIQ